MKKPLIHYWNRGLISIVYGGKIGIRTLGALAYTTDFESVPFGHSGIFPRRGA